MSDAVMVPREPTEAMIDNAAWYATEETARDIYRAMLAASPSVGGWEEPVAWRGEADGIDECTTRPDTRDDWIRYGRKITPLYAAPPPVSTGSRPQEAILPQTEKGS